MANIRKPPVIICTADCPRTDWPDDDAARVGGSDRPPRRHLQREHATEKVQAGRVGRERSAQAGQSRTRMPTKPTMSPRIAVTPGCLPVGELARRCPVGRTGRSRIRTAARPLGTVLLRPVHAAVAEAETDTPCTARSRQESGPGSRARPGRRRRQPAGATQRSIGRRAERGRQRGGAHSDRGDMVVPRMMQVAAHAR